MAWTAGSRIQAAALNNASPQLFQEVSLSSTTANVTINIPVGFSRVQVYWRARMSDANAAEQLYLRLNGDSGSNYLWEVCQSQNTTVAATTSGAATTFIQIGTVTAASATALYFASGEFTVDGIADTTNYKTANGTGTAYTSTTNMYTGTYGGQWNSAALVTSFTLSGSTGQFLAGSVITAYGMM